MCQVFSVVVLICLLTATLMMSSVFLRCSGEKNWTYWILSIVMCGVMTIAGIAVKDNYGLSQNMKMPVFLLSGWLNLAR